MMVASTSFGSLSEVFSDSPPPMHQPSVATLAPPALDLSHSSPASSTASPHCSSFLPISAAASFGSVATLPLYRSTASARYPSSARWSAIDFIQSLRPHHSCRRSTAPFAFPFGRETYAFAAPPG